VWNPGARTQGRAGFSSEKGDGGLHETEGTRETLELRLLFGKKKNKVSLLFHLWDNLSKDRGGDGGNRQVES